MERFIARHALDDFRHRARLFAALADGTCAPRDIPRALRRTPTCGKLVEDGFAQAGPDVGGPYAASLAEDWAAVRKAVAAHPSHHGCDAWVFDMVPGFRFRVFECVEDHAILGCVLDHDPRLTDAETWLRYFG